MAKKMKTGSDITKNLDRHGNSKGFNKGSVPTQYGPDSVSGGSPAYTNTIGGTPDANTDKGKTYEKRMITPRDPVLNAVSMPNNTKMNKKNYGVLDYQGTPAASQKWVGSNVPVGGTPKPNNIK